MADTPLDRASILSSLEKIQTGVRFLLRSQTYLTRYLKDAELMSFVKDKSTLINKVRVLTNDVEQLRIRLDDLDSEVVDLKNIEDDTDLLQVASDLHQGYIGVSTTVETVVIPMAQSIAEIIGDAETLKINAGK